ncbi:transposase domain-containing protein [Bradyrhizobium sp. AUGA SZCCT0240]
MDPLANLTSVLTRIRQWVPNRDIDQLLPWTFRT